MALPVEAGGPGSGRKSTEDRCRRWICLAMVFRTTRTAEISMNSAQYRVPTRARSLFFRAQWAKKATERMAIPAPLSMKSAVNIKSVPRPNKTRSLSDVFVNKYPCRTMAKVTTATAAVRIATVFSNAVPVRSKGV